MSFIMNYSCFHFSLRSSGLDLVNSDSFIRKELTPRLIFTLSKLLDQFVETWQQQEERRRQKEEEDDCLYRYKAQLHGDERMEAEKEEDEFKQNFPSFEQVINLYYLIYTKSLFLIIYNDQWKII